MTAAPSTRSTSVYRRRLAYEIAKHAEGIYAVVDVKAEPPPCPSSTVSST